MTTIVRPATADRFDDLRKVLVPSGNNRACWCLSYRLTSAEQGKLAVDDRPGVMRALTERPVAPGVIAYVDDEPAGWCGFGPRAEMGRLVRSKTIQRIDDLPVWSIVCFVVRAPFRRQGIAKLMLDAAVDYARDHGAPALEAYPIDPAGGRVSASFAFVGTTRLFESAGFERVAVSSSRSAGLERWIVRRSL